MKVTVRQRISTAILILFFVHPISHRPPDLLWVTMASLALLVLIPVFYGQKLKMNIEFIENELAKCTWFGRIEWCRDLGRYHDKLSGADFSHQGKRWGKGCF